MFICFILPAEDWIGLGGRGGGGGVEGSTHSSVTGNGVCGQVYCAGYTQHLGVSIQLSCSETVSARFHGIMPLCYKNKFMITV